jgi:putative transposase
LREAFAEQLEVVHRLAAFQLIAWVIMPEHVHLLLIPSLPDWPVPRILTAIKRPFAELMIRRWRQLDAPILPRLFVAGQCYRFWMRGGGYDRNIESAPAVYTTIDYMHANPERRGLAMTAEQWRWSSARWYAGDRSGPVTLDPMDFL